MTDAPHPDVPRDVPEPSPDDARLLEELGAVLRPDPVPPQLLSRAEALVELLDLDHDLAALQEAGPAELAGTRGAGTTAGLLFERPDGSVALEVHVGREELTGQLLAGDAQEVVLERLSGEPVAATVDELGAFTFGRVAPGPVRLRLPSAARPLTTDWFLV